MWAFSSCGEQGLLLVAGHGLLIAVSSLSLQSTGSRLMGSSSCRLWARSCGAQASLLHGMWNLPGPEMEPMSLAKADRFLSTAPPGKSE